jgi:hypothetical protein
MGEIMTKPQPNTRRGMMKLDDIELCQNKLCDKGYVITDKKGEGDKFILDKCPECEGRGFKLKD